MKRWILGISLVLVFLISLAPVSANVWEGLVAYYNFNESSGSNLPDLALSDNNGTLMNMEVGDWRTGILDNCLFFDGVDEFVNITNSAPLNPENITISFWFNQTTKVNDAGIVTKGSAGGGERQYNVFQSTVNNITGTINNSAFTGAGTWADDGKWYHFAVTYNGTGIAVYMNGTLAYTTAFAGGGIDATTYDLYIGRAEWNIFYTGEVDELGMWNRSLSALEISELYNNGVGLTYTPTVSLVSLIASGTYYETQAVTSLNLSSNFAANTPPLVNTTFYLWDSDKTLLGTNTTIITGNSNSTSSGFLGTSVTDFTLGENYT